MGAGLVWFSLVP